MKNILTKMTSEDFTNRLLGFTICALFVVMGIAAAITPLVTPSKTPELITRNGITVDQATGCEYISEDGLTPRIGRDGVTHAGCKGVPKPLHGEPVEADLDPIPGQPFCGPDGYSQKSAVVSSQSGWVVTQSSYAIDAEGNKIPCEANP